MEMNMAEHHESFELIAAFADGERVDTQALRAALADDAGRDYLIDLLAMREIVGHAEAPARPVPAAGHWSRTMTGLAAVLVMAVGIAGYVIGIQRSQAVPVVMRPPL